MLGPTVCALCISAMVKWGGREVSVVVCRGVSKEIRGGPRAAGERRARLTQQTNVPPTSFPTFASQALVGRLLEVPRSISSVYGRPDLLVPLFLASGVPECVYRR